MVIQTPLFMQKINFTHHHFVLNQLTESMPLTVSERYSIALNTHLAFLKDWDYPLNIAGNYATNLWKAGFRYLLHFDSNEQERYKKSLWLLSSSNLTFIKIPYIAMQ